MAGGEQRVERAHRQFGHASAAGIGHSLMPGNVASASPSGVMPWNLCTAFEETRTYPLLETKYHDGTSELGQLGQTSRKSWKLSQRITASALAGLKTFFEAQQGGMTPFLFYNVFEGTYDPSGDSLTGRYTVVFRGNWQQTTEMQRSTIPQLDLIEVA
jgi:hypothetical protein